MKIHMYIDDTDIEPADLRDIFPAISKEISDWVGDKKTTIYALSKPTTEEADTHEQKLGLAIQTKSKHKLKDPLNFLYSLAKTYKCEFVIAEVDPDTGSEEEVCYFGYEEGRPDLFEIANYLAL